MVFELLGQTFPGTPAVRADRVLFGTLLQSGAEHFEMGPGELPLWRSSFMRDRMSAISEADYDDARSLVETLFSAHLPADWGRNLDFRHAWPASMFLTDLLFALRRRAGLVLLVEPSEIESNQLPPELRQLVHNIVASITWAEAASPVPVGSLSGESASVLREVVESSLFLDYSATHERLEARIEDHRPMLEEMAERASDLVKRFRDRISLGRSALGLLPGVGAAFSGGPKGSEPWAKLGAALGDTAAWHQRRIAVYRCAPMLRRLLVDTMVDIGGRLKAEEDERKKLDEG
jgi:hypothetical protein